MKNWCQIFRVLIVFWLVCNLVNGYSQSQRFFEEGLLENNDLMYVNQLDSINYNPSFNIGYLLVKYKQKDSVLFVPRVISYFEIDRSNLGSSTYSKDFLNYNQAVFNVYEIEARKLQKVVIEQDFITNGNLLLKSTIDSIEAQLDFFKKFSNNGKDTLVVNKILEQTNRELKESELYWLPELKKRNFSGGLFVGYSQGFTTQYLKPIIPSLYGTELGVNLFYKKFGSITSITLMSSIDNKSEQSGVRFTTEDYIGGSLNFGTFSLTYLLLDTKKHRIYPFLGLAFSDVSLGRNDTEFSTRSLAYGVYYNYKFKKRVDYSPVKFKEFQDFYLFTSLLMNQINHDVIKGSAYSFSIGIGYNVGFLKSGE